MPFPRRTNSSAIEWPRARSAGTIAARYDSAFGVERVLGDDDSHVRLMGLITT